MKVNVSFILMLFVITCNHNLHNKQNKSSVVHNTSIDIVSEFETPNTMIGVDSIKLLYVSPHDGFHYMFKYSNGELKIARTWEGRTISNIPLNKDSSTEMIVDRFINSIDSFFISKSDSIEFKKVRRDYQICSDYPVLTCEIYMENHSVIKQTHQIGYEEYDVEYNPKFLEFYEFLDKLVRTPRGITEGDTMSYQSTNNP